MSIQLYLSTKPDFRTFPFFNETHTKDGFDLESNTHIRILKDKRALRNELEFCRKNGFTKRNGWSLVSIDENCDQRDHIN